jgi:putative endonuclease
LDEEGAVAFVYMLRCSDGAYYVGSTRTDLESRIGAHNIGHYGGFTKSRLPVTLVWSQEIDRITDAIAAERQIKGWRREKKEALIGNDFQRIKRLASRAKSNSSFETRPTAAPQDED